MSKIKNFEPALYESNFEAIKTFIKEGRSPNYNFEVYTKEAALNALNYLCVNNINHTITSTGAQGIYLITLTWYDGFYCFWCEGEI